MKVLVLGGTGAMGAHLVGQLVASGAEVAVTSRSRRGSVPGLCYIQGNAHDETFIREILRESWDAIVDFMVYSTEEFAERIDLLLSSAGQYVFLSSARVYADCAGAITEDSPRLLDVSKDTEFLASDEYALSKARQENLLFDAGCDNWTVIRPYITYGEERLQLGFLEKEGWLYRALHGRSIVFSKDVCFKATTLTYGMDVARAILAVIGRAQASGNVFHITSPKSISWGRVLSIYVDIFEERSGVRPKVLLQDLNGVCAWHRPKYQILYDRMYDRIFDNSKINRYINTDDFVDPELGLKRGLESFLDAPRFLSIDWRAEALKDRFSTERSLLSEVGGLKQKLKYFVFRDLPVMSGHFREGI